MVIGVCVVAGAGLTWALAFSTAWSSSEWNEEWHGPSELRGKGVYIANREVETTEEREKRLKKIKIVNGEVGELKKTVLGDQRAIRGNDILPDTPDRPEGFDFNPREACLQMKMEFPERYGNVDCMSDRYDSRLPWWKVGIHGY